MVKNLSIDACLELLQNNHVGKLAYIYGQWPHITPITYCHDSDEKCIISYSAEGHKMHAMRSYGNVALQVDEIVTIQEWKSVLVQGQFEQLNGSSAKYYLHRFAQGVRSAIERQGGETPRFIKDFSSKLDDRGMPLVYRISITDIVGKYRRNT